MGSSQKEIQDKVTLLESGGEQNPDHLLGFQGDQIRFWRPGFDTLQVQMGGATLTAEKIAPAGLFQVPNPAKVALSDVRVCDRRGVWTHDPYLFSPSLTEMELYLINKGVHYQIYQTLGAQLIEHQGVQGVRFAVWAPNAKGVSIIGEFNEWNPQCFPLRLLADTGIWELFIPEICEGERYLFVITTRKDEKLLKSDPFAFSSDMRPDHASIVTRKDQLVWTDDHWMGSRGNIAAPMNIYEVHLGSWRHQGDDFPNYRHLAHDLAAYCLQMGYTHVELLPIMEHPLDESWGYQVTGFYAVTSRYGTLLDFQWFVNTLHQQGIGVILDWVPAHFPNDAFALSHFDGTGLYEHEDPRKGFHPHWNTHIFDYGRTEVVNFLIGSALYWLDQCHIDGLRVDAVASMLHLDYGREEGNWIPNAHGGHENLEAIAFIKHLNSVTQQRFPSTFIIAEDSTTFPLVTTPVEKGGLGFTMKWNMGWMNDTLSFFHQDFEERSQNYRQGRFPYHYAFREKFALPLSHDEVVHCKKSLLEKMPGPLEQQFASLRLLFSCMICHPGKKVLFMGGEFGQINEWDCKGQLDWQLLDDPMHKVFQTFVKRLNHFYLHHPALWERDFDPQTLEWVTNPDDASPIACYLRHGQKQSLLIVHNFSEHAQPYSPHAKNLLFSTEPRMGDGTQIPPLSTQIFEVVND